MIGIVVVIYWSRVLMMVQKARRKAGHDANFIPKETVGRWMRVIWNPVIALWAILPFFAAFGSKKYRFFNSLYSGSMLTCILCWIAAAVAVVALYLTFICWKKMGSDWRMGIDPNDKTNLIVSGPYSYVRHPIYALSSLIMICSMIVVASPMMILVGELHLILLQWEARREEKYMTTIHGQEYVSYARQTGRFIPKSFKPYQK